jgi:hypothetical protein
MDQDKKTTSGAPSSDTTSALFVSARKKQLEQQEVERRAKEKEDQRLAAEAEVRRLEHEVEERRRKAEEDKIRAEEEAKRIAEEAREKQARAAEAPDSVLGAPPPKKESKLPGANILSGLGSGGSGSGSGGGGGSASGAAKAPANKKLPLIIGGAAAVVVLIVILAVNLGGDKTPAPGANGGENQANVTGGMAPYAGDLDEVDSDWQLNPAAALDTLATHRTLKLGLAYPASEFVLSDLGDDDINLISRDGNAVISLMALTPYNNEGGGFRREEMIAVKDAMLASTEENMSGDTEIIQNEYKSELSIAYFALSYDGEEERRYVGVTVRAWITQPDGSPWFYGALLDCPIDQVGEYLEIYDRICASRSDV